MNKFSSLGVLIVGFLVAGSIALANEYDASKDLYNPEVKSALNCVKGAAEDFITSNKDFNDCLIAINEPLHSFTKSEINKYLTSLSDTQIQTLTSILSRALPSNLTSKRQLIDSFLDEIVEVSQTCDPHHQEAQYDDDGTHKRLRCNDNGHYNYNGNNDSNKYTPKLDEDEDEDNNY